MLEKQTQDSRPDLVETQKPTDTKNVRNALSSSIHGILAAGGYKEGTSTFTDHYLQLLDQAPLDKTDQLVTLGVVLLDTLLVNELATDKNKLGFGKSSYGRSDAETMVNDLPEMHKFIKSETAKDLRSMQIGIFTESEMREWDTMTIEIMQNNQENVFGDVDSYLKGLKENKFDPASPVNIYIRQPIDLHHFSDIHQSLITDDLPEACNTEFYVQIKNYYLHMIVQKLSPRMAMGRMIDAPDQTVPRMELWKQYILSGYSLFPDAAPTPLPPHQDDSSSTWEEDYQTLLSELGTDSHLSNSIIRKKYASFLSHDQDPKFYSRATSLHIAREFGGADNPTIRLTRSGASANLLGFYLAADYCGGQLYTRKHRTPLFIDPDFYYENKHGLNQSNFHTVDTKEEASIFALSADINTPLHTQAEFKAHQQELLDFIYAKAAVHPNDQFAIVYDKTAQPGSHLVHPAGQMPRNIKVIETISFSKFQRGGKNAFYGAVLYPDSIEEPTLNIFENQALSTPTDYNLITYPHVTRQEIQTMTDRNQKLFVELQSDVAPDFRLVGADNYFFIIPPEKFWQDNSRKSLELINQVIETFKPSNIVETGDSYGTKETRLTRFVVGQTKAEDPDYYKAIPSLRIAYGLKPNIAQLRNILHFAHSAYDNLELN